MYNYDLLLCLIIFVYAADHTWTNVNIGATQVPHSAVDFTWLNGEPLNITATKPFWVKNRPVTSYNHGVILLLRYKSFKWLEKYRHKIRHFICERPFLQWGRTVASTVETVPDQWLLMTVRKIVSIVLLSQHLCRPLRHISMDSNFRPHPVKLIPHRGPSSRGPQQETSDPLTSCHPKYTALLLSHFCGSNLVMPVSDSTYAGHCLLCPLLTTVLSKSRTQTRWASPPESGTPLTCPSISLNCYADSLTSKALIRTAPGKEGLLLRDTHSEATTTAWNEGPKGLRLLFLFCFVFVGWCIVLR